VHAGTSLRLAFRRFDGFERALERQIEQFERATPDISVDRHPLDLEDLRELMVAGGGCLSGDWDLFLCVTDWLPGLIEQRKLRPLGAFLIDDPPEGWPASWSSSVLRAQTTEGDTFGFPYHDGPEMFMYRADLFDDLSERTAFSRRFGYKLEPPTTWSQFRDCAEFFTRPEEGLYGCVLAALPDAHNSVYDFLIHLWSRGGSLLRGQGAAFDSTEGRAALGYITDLIRHGLTQPDPFAYDSVRSGDAYASGMAAMMWNWGGFGVVADMPPSKIIGRSRYGLIPRGDGPQGRHVSLSVYWVMAIPIGSRHPEAAWSFMKACASESLDRITSSEGAIGCRLSTWRDDELQQKFPCYAALEKSHSVAEVLPTLPLTIELIDVLNRAIDDAHRGRMSVDSALTSAAREVDNLMASHDRAGGQTN
jgi:multiple sugar transport system substrate-binding protein